MRSLCAVLLFAGLSSALHISAPMSKAKMEEVYGQVTWDKNVKTDYCSQCVEVEVSSTGGASQYQENRLGRYTVAGALWENMVPFFEATNGQLLSPGPYSNPVIYTVMWIVSETLGGFNAGLQNKFHVDGINCPWEFEDGWEYEHQFQWTIDPTLS